jgi:hypothetical protein
MTLYCSDKSNKKFWEEIIVFFIFRGYSDGITDGRQLCTAMRWAQME